MDFTVSALSFVGPKMKWMAQLPKDIGIEISGNTEVRTTGSKCFPSCFLKEAVRSASTVHLSAKIFLRQEIQKQL